MIVRPLAPADRAGFEPLWQGYLDFYRQTLPPAQTELTWGRLLDPLEPMFGLAAEHGGALAGFATYLVHRSTWARVGYVYLEDLFVDASARGKGIGGALIEGVYAAADAIGADRVYWATQSNNPARKLYDRYARDSGFVQYRR